MSQGSSSYGLPVAFCTDAMSPQNLPWYTIYVTSTNIRLGKGTRPGISKALLDLSMCYGKPPALVGSVHLDEVGANHAAFKLVPTTQRYGDQIIFELYNREYGKVRSAYELYSLGSTNLNYYLTTGESLRSFVGFVFQGVTLEFPMLKPGILPPFKLLYTYGTKIYAEDPNIPHKNNMSACDYVFGWQSFNDKNDIPTLELVSQDPQYATEPIVLPMDPILVSNCIMRQCSQSPFPLACRDYLNANPDPSLIRQLLGPRCSAGNAESMTSDCQLWCRLGVSTPSGPGDEIVHQACKGSRSKYCAGFYDPSTTDGYRAGTAEAVKSQCACYMPDAFYQLITEGRIDPKTNPQCFYRRCTQSQTGTVTYTPTNCSGVAICVQEGGITEQSCVIGTELPVSPPPAPIPPPPRTSFPWWIVVLITISIMVLLGVIITIAYSKPKVNWAPLFLWSQSRS